jgi:plastocyanin
MAAAAATLLAARRAARAQDAHVEEVTIDNFAFAPETIHVAVGGSVGWVNHDDIPHSIVIPALKVHSHALDTDQRFEQRFAEAGSYDYFCGLHPHMKGKVIVA